MSLTLGMFASQRFGSVLGSEESFTFASVPNSSRLPPNLKLPAGSTQTICPQAQKTRWIVSVCHLELD